MRRREILDPCCGSRMWHFDKECPEVLYMDNRRLFEELSDGRTLSVKPDELGDFTNMKYDDNTFSLVVFDPPHLLRAGENSWLRKKYGVLSDNWRRDIKRGLSECWRVLKPSGTLVFKWNEEQISFSDVKYLLPCVPIVGHRRGKTIFLVFFKGKEDEERKGEDRI